MRASSSRPTALPSTHEATSTSPRSRTPSAGRTWTRPESSAACPSTAACEGAAGPNRHSERSRATARRIRGISN